MPVESSSNRHHNMTPMCEQYENIDHMSLKDNESKTRNHTE